MEFGQATQPLYPFVLVDNTLIDLLSPLQGYFDAAKMQDYFGTQMFVH